MNPRISTAHQGSAVNAGNSSSLSGYDRIRGGDFLMQFGILLLITAAVHLYRIEESLRLPEVMPVLAVAFALNAWLPLRWRLPVWCC